MLMRRLFPRSAVLLGVLALLFALAPTNAGAVIGWCAGDPVVKVSGRVVNIMLSSYDTLNETTTGPAEVVVTIPSTATAQLLETDSGFGGYGYTVSFVKSDSLKMSDGLLPIVISVFVPSSEPLPVQVDLVTDSSRIAQASTLGATGEWITLRTS
jgi:hypothetical protein